MTSDKPALYWDYESRECESAGALPPENLRLPWGQLPPESPFPSPDYHTLWRAIETGYRVQPADCPAIRVISGYGFLVRCPGDVIASRLRERACERVITDECSRFGHAELAGSSWPGSDSDRVASWIAGSEFIKIQTGIRIYFNSGWWLYQGPPPNTGDDARYSSIMSGIEYPTPAATVTIEGQTYGISQLNVIVRLPPLGEQLRFARGDALCWFFAVPKKSVTGLASFTELVSGAAGQANHTD